MGAKYTPEDDRLIWDTVQAAEAAGIELGPVFMKLAEDLGRLSGRNVEMRYLKQIKHRYGAENDGNGAPDVLNIVGRVKAALRERDAYRAKYEAEKEAREKLEQENEFKIKYEDEKRQRQTLERQLNQLKKLLG